MATLDHLFERGHPMRTSQDPALKRHVLACYACNHARGAAYLRALQEAERCASR